jgi:hypothetical protein
MHINVFRRDVMRKIFRFKGEEITRVCPLSKGLNKLRYNLLYKPAFTEASVYVRIE